MKICVGRYLIDDSDYWEITHHTELLARSMPQWDHWQDLGVEFSVVEITDITRHRRSIEIWASGEEKTLVLMALRS